MTPKTQYKIERAAKRRVRNKERFREWRLKHPPKGTCKYCGTSSRVVWCEGCQMFSCFECDSYGTCMCN